MDKPRKLGRRSPAEALIKQPRNPLKDLNTTSFPPPPSVSGEIPKGGCLRFLLSNPSTSKEPNLRYKSHQRSPKSAPPNSRNQPIKSQSSKNSQNNTAKPTSENPKKTDLKRSTKSGTPDLLPWRSRKKPESARGKSSITDLKFNVGLAGSGGIDATPQKTLQGSAPVMGSVVGTTFAPNNDGDQLSKTPTSNATPPIQASISPEIAGGSSVIPTPACFGAGHVIARVHDRRKCRPRGILTIENGQQKVVKNQSLGLSQDWDDEFRVSLAAPPLVDASIRWLSSPSENASASKGGCLSSGVGSKNQFGEASMKWLLAHREDKEESVEKTPALATRGSPNHETWSFSPIDSNITPSSPLETTTPSSGFGICRSSISSSSTSPFSMIVRRAEALSKCRAIQALQEKGTYPYVSAVETSLSGDLSGNGNGNGSVVFTPPSHSSSKKHVELSPFDLDSIPEILGNMSLSPKPVPQSDEQNDILKLGGLSFQFGCPGTPLNSIDWSFLNKPSCKKSSRKEESHLNKKNSSRSEMRISWREGLVSRIFEMDELDCCQWLSDGEDNVDNSAEKLGSKSFLQTEANIRSLMTEDGDDQISAFGSFEFPTNEIGIQNSKAKHAYHENSCAESISTEGGGLISSGESDWTLFYKNGLFEV